MLAFVTPAQNDTFWHLRSGQAMWQARRLLTTEPFSHTAYGSPLVNHWWLSQLAFYGIFRLGGAPLVSVAAGACAFVAVRGAYRLCRGSFEVRLLLLAFLVVSTAPEWAVRPQVISLALLVAAVYLVERDRTAWLPVLCLVWANMHAMAIYGVMIAAAAAAEAVAWSRSRVRRDLVVLAFSLLAPAVSPAGWRYWPRVLETVSMSKALDLQEYRMPLQAGFAPFWIALALFGILVVKRRRELADAARSRRILVLAAGAAGIAAVTALRNVAFFAVVAAPVLAWLLNPSANSRTLTGKRVPLAVAAIAFSIALVVGVLFVASRWRDGGVGAGWRPISPAAVEAVRHCPDPLFNHLKDGGYVMWTLPGRRVFVDSRMEAYPLALLQESRAADLDGEYRRLFQRYGIRCALVGTPTEMARRLSHDPAMKRTYADRDYMVFVR